MSIYFFYFFKKIMSDPVKDAIHKLRVTKSLANATAVNASKAIDDLQSQSMNGGKRKRKAAKGTAAPKRRKHKK
jgi:hypothetical protein